MDIEINNLLLILINKLEVNISYFNSGEKLYRFIFFWVKLNSGEIQHFIYEEICP